MLKIRLQGFISVIVVILSMTACRNDSTINPAPTKQEVLTTGAGYPAPVSSPEILSPETGYPSPDSVNNPNATLLAFDRPIQSTDSLMTGVGPIGLTVYILNMTLMGTELGSGTIGNDGTFAIAVSELQPGTRIGLTADLTTIGLTEKDIQPGEGQMAMPRVGYFFDSVVLPQQ